MIEITVATTCGVIFGLALMAWIDWTKGARERAYRRGFTEGTNIERDLHVCNDLMAEPETCEGEITQVGAGSAYEATASK